jgi:hypothetical protein
VTDAGLASTGGKMYMIFDKRAFLGYQVFDDAPTWSYSTKQRSTSATSPAESEASGTTDR